MTKALRADQADAHMVAHQGEQGATPEERKAMEEWSPSLGKKDESNRLADIPTGSPEKMNKDDKAAVIRAKNEAVVPKYPSVEFEIVGRAITYDKETKERKEDYTEQTIYFQTVGNKDIDIVERYRAEKAYAVVAYHNFPPEAHPKFVEFAKLKQLLDGYIDPVEARRARARNRA